MPFEKCESKISNLLVSLENLPRAAVMDKLVVLEEILAIQEKEIVELQEKVADMPKITVDDGFPSAKNVARFEMHFMGENYVWFRAVTNDGRKYESLPLKGEV